MRQVRREKGEMKKKRIKISVIAAILLFFPIACVNFIDNNYADFEWVMDGSGGIIITAYRVPGDAVDITE